MEDNKIELPIESVLSYSRIDVFKQCPFRYKLKYIDGNYTDTTSLALQIGTLLHYANELKYDVNSKMTLDEIWNIVENGYKADNEDIIGLNDIISEYPFDYYETDIKNGMTMEDKINKFKITFYTEVIESEWETIGLEKEFVITFNNKARIKGFIDRIDRNKTTGDIRVIDYKTNGKLYDKKDLATPLQMYIYSLACYEMYGQYPSDCIYDMLFMCEKQSGGTNGYLNRGFKALNKILDSLIYYQDLGFEYMKPKPTPLCHWCDYCKTNPNSSDFYNNLCDYHSNWTRENKTFTVNKEWKEPVSQEDDDWDW